MSASSAGISAKRLERRGARRMRRSSGMDMSMAACRQQHLRHFRDVNRFTSRKWRARLLITATLPALPATRPPAERAYTPTARGRTLSRPTTSCPPATRVCPHTPATSQVAERARALHSCVPDVCHRPTARPCAFANRPPLRVLIRAHPYARTRITPALPCAFARPPTEHAHTPAVHGRRISSYD